MSKEVTNEELARMIAKGFETTASKADLDGLKVDIKRIDGRIDTLDGHVSHIDGRMDHLDARIGRMEADLHEIKGNIVYKYEFEDLSARVKYIESKMGIESGK